MFWLKLGLILFAVMALIFVVKFSLRKILKIEKTKRDFFSYNHVNKLHGKIDWSLRIISMITYSILLYLLLYQDISIFFIVFALVILIVLDYIVRAFFEWKYTQNPKQSILTIIEMFLLVVAILTIVQLNILNVNLN